MTACESAAPCDVRGGTTLLLLTRGMTRELHVDPFVIGESSVILAQNRKNFRSREFRRHGASFREPLAKLSTRHEQPVLITVRAGAPGRHAAACVAPERPVDL